MHLDLIGEKFDGTIRALGRLPSQLPLGSSSSTDDGLDDLHREVLATLLTRSRAATAPPESPRADGIPSEEPPHDLVAREHGTECVLATLRSEWAWLSEALRYRRPPGQGPVTDLDTLPVGTGADLEAAIAALYSEQGLAELALSACHEGGCRILGAAVEAARGARASGLVDRLVEQYRQEAVEGILQDVVRAVDQELSTAGIGPVRATKRPKTVRGNGVLLLPISVRKLVVGEQGSQLISEVALPVPEHSVDVMGPSVPVDAADSGKSGSSGDAEETHGVPRPPWAPPTPNADLDEEGFAVTGRPGLRSSTSWEGFSRIEDDLGNRYLVLLEVEKAQPGLCRLFGTQRVTQTLFPSLAPEARRLELTNPGHLIWLVPTRGGQPAAHPEARTAHDGVSITVRL